MYSLNILSCTARDMQFMSEWSLTKQISAHFGLIFGVCLLNTTKQPSVTLTSILYDTCSIGDSYVWLKTLRCNTVKMAYFRMLKQVRQCFVIACWGLQGSSMTHTAKVQCMLSTLQRICSLHQVFSISYIAPEKFVCTEASAWSLALPWKDPQSSPVCPNALLFRVTCIKLLQGLQHTLWRV